MKLRYLFLRMYRNALPLVCSMIAGFALGFVHLIFAEPKYTANAAMLLETSAGELGQIDATFLDLDTHASLIHSDPVVAHVVSQLDLHEHNEFRLEIGPVESLLDYSKLRLSQPLFGGVRHLDEIIEAKEREIERTTEAFRVLSTVAKVREKLTVVRQGQSRILRLEFTSGDAKLSADVTNSFVETYLDHLAPIGGPRQEHSKLTSGAVSGDLNVNTGIATNRDFRVVSWAFAPTYHTRPDIRVVLTVYTIMGLAFGLMLAVHKETRLAMT